MLNKKYLPLAIASTLFFYSILILFQNCAKINLKNQNTNVEQYLDENPESKLTNKFNNQKENESSYLNSPFGFHSAYYRPFVKTNELVDLHDVWSEKNRENAYKDAINIGVRWERVGGRVPEKNNPYDWTLSDTQYSFIPKGINILTNIWVRETEFLKPGTWQFQNEQYENAYIQYLKALVERYDGDGKNDMPGLKNPVHYWQIENEVIVNNLKTSGPVDLDNIELNLDWEAYSKLIKISYDVIKSVDPTAKVLIGGTLGGESLYEKKTTVYNKQLNEFFLPLLKKLKGKGIDIFDIHYYGFASTKKEANWFGSKKIFQDYRKILDENGYENIPIWYTESGSPGFLDSEVSQAIDVIKRFIFPLSYGVKKIFWAWALVEGYPPLTGEDYFDHTGLIYDGIGKGDPGYGVKKLSYYSYKLLTERLSKVNLDTLKTIQEKNNIYIYRVRNNKSKYIWIIWNDSDEEQLISISKIKSNQVRITEMVPDCKYGKDVIDYTTAFRKQNKKTEDGKISFYVKDKPFLIEEE